MHQFTWVYEQTNTDWQQLSELYRIAPLGNKAPEDLEIVFSNSKFTCFVFDHAKIIGVGRALADGVDCSYICDVAIDPEYQGMGLGRQVIKKLLNLSAGHKKIILYANPGKEGFYTKLGFKQMNTAMAIFSNEQYAIDVGLINSS
ncbi:MAG: ribosomal protein S18 acetylase RimI-like enzyme [Paraglaciecola sp.]|jgi:ribosomal protein S18 acetylase RimI-like enzyme